MQAFSGIQDEFYPGSKHRRRESRQARQARLTTEREEAKAGESWDAHPIKGKTAGGVPLGDLFLIGALAKALGRDSNTLRAWIRKGWLPKAKYQTSPLPGTRGDASRRLWSRAQIEGIVQIAEEEGLLNDNPARIQRTKFTQRVRAEWKGWL